MGHPTCDFAPGICLLRFENLGEVFQDHQTLGKNRWRPAADRNCKIEIAVPQPQV